MIKAEITLRTCYGDAIIPVEVFGKGPRPGTAWVRALNGLKPFTKISHGGPCQDSASIVLIPHLRDVRIEEDLKEEKIKGPTLQNGINVPFPIPDQRAPTDWLLESAYTVCTQPPEGGEA